MTTFTVSPATIVTGDKSITFPTGSVWSNSLGAFKSISSAVTVAVPDGYLLALDFSTAGTALTAANFLVAQISTFAPTRNKYILFIHYDKRLISPIPLYQVKLDKLYNPVTQVLSKLIPWYDNVGISPATSAVDNETVTFPANSLWSSTTGKYCTLKTQQSFSIPDGSILTMTWDDTVTVLDQPASNFLVETLTAYVPNNKKHVLFINYAGILKSPIPLYAIKIDHVYNGSNYIANFKNVFTVAKSGGNYTTIQAAVDAALDSTSDKVTIRVMPGTYNESVNIGGARHISLVGLNKNTCIIRDDSGQYNNAPLEIEGEAYIANLTFISTHDNDQVTAVDSLRGYAVHSDYDGVGTTEFNNCVFISNQNAAIGIGLHQDQTLKLVNCELYSYTPLASSMTANGALFCHSAVASGVTGQHLIVDNCKIVSDKSYAAYINDANYTNGDNQGNTMDVTFYNTMIYSNELGKLNVIKKDTPKSGKYSGGVALNIMSFGNNLAELNV
jgi:hypothetical protein